MHPNPAFRGTSVEQSLAFARSRGFGILGLNGSDRPLHAHIPFLLTADGQNADLHLARSNAIARAVAVSAPVLLTISGPDAYISPDWYGVPDMVPTWNYVAVNLIGRLERLPDAAMHDMLVRQSHDFEKRLAPKPEWKIDKLSPDTLAKLVRMIVPFRLQIEDVEATWKLSQNRTPEARLAAADGIADAAFGSDTDEIVHLMREL
jgi:transcriptional regulator